MGKMTLARAIAASLLCEGDQREEMPCGKCRACRQMENLSHPDLIVMQKGEPLIPADRKKTVIPVDDIREMIRRTGLRGFESNRHAIIVRHAEDMTEEAQNAMLKTLEEPPEGTFFLLTSVNGDRLLPTIVSRCRPIRLHAWSGTEILRALEENGQSGPRVRSLIPEAEGSIGKALRMAGDANYQAFREEVIRDFLDCPRRGDILSVSNKWKDRRNEAEEAFSVMDHFFSSLARDGLGQGMTPEERSVIPKRWQVFAGKAGPEDYVRLMEAVSLARRRVEGSVSFQAVIEQLILNFMEAVVP